MIVVEDTVISPDLIDEYFCCDLNTCRGVCCVEGESGAPVEVEEIACIEETLPLIWNDLAPEAQEVIKQQGVVYFDADGDCVTSIVNGKDCVFTYYDENGCCLCAFEKSFREGKSSFYKPISCHLYPVRVSQYKDFRAVNCHKWKICDVARILGKTKNIKMYQFLKEPLIRKFGEKWYEELIKNTN